MVSLEGPGKLGLRYLLLDPTTGEVVITGDAVAGPGSGEFVVNLSSGTTSGLFPGLYKMSFAAFSDAIALVADRTVDVEVSR